jgi:deoxyribose-phosphate aldolase
MKVAAAIEHTRLGADTRPSDVERLCAEAQEYGFAGVCVNPVYVTLARRALPRGVVVTVVGFPLGASLRDVDALATRRALDDGANEIDMVIPVGFALAGDLDAVTAHVGAVRAACGDAVLKVILETGYFGESELPQLARAALLGGADYLKTSTGMGPRGASEADVRCLAAVAAGAERTVRVKASGGIRDLEQAQSLLAAGAARLGSSSGVTIAQAEALLNSTPG